MSIKTAIVDGPIAPELTARLESMGFEIVDMNDALAMEALRRRLMIEEILRKMHDATGSPMIDIQQALRRGEAEFEGHEDQKTPFPSDRPRELLPFLLRTIEPTSVDPIDTPTTIKKEGSKFYDNIPGYSRRGRARNQGFASHFKHK